MRRLLGQATRRWANGDSFTGNLQAGEPHGEGVMRYDDGAMLTGQWAAGRAEGKVERIEADGQVLGCPCPATRLRAATKQPSDNAILQVSFSFGVAGPDRYATKFVFGSSRLAHGVTVWPIMQGFGFEFPPGTLLTKTKM